MRSDNTIIILTYFSLISLFTMNSSQIDKILSIKYLTLIVKIDGTYLIGDISQADRDKLLEKEYPNVGWSVIDHDDAPEGISVIYRDNYRIDKIGGTNHSDKKGQQLFWRENIQMFNLVASRIANKLDKNFSNCIIGNCAFVFEDPTNFSEDKLSAMVNLIDSRYFI